jgi:hypothetical protein
MTYSPAANAAARTLRGTHAGTHAGADPLPTNPGGNAVERFLPIGVGGLSTIAASILDTNFGTVAAGITALSTAIGAGIWQVSSRKTAAFKEAETARREAYRDDEMAKIEIQRQRDQLNKDSLSARLDQMGAQLTMIQRSADEANRSLEDARQFNAALRASLDDANRKVE